MFFDYYCGHKRDDTGVIGCDEIMDPRVGARGLQKSVIPGLTRNLGNDLFS